MALKKILKGLEQSLKLENEKKPSTLIGVIFRKFKIRGIENRIIDIKTELYNRKTKK
jgi:hypothetical protein